MTAKGNKGPSPLKDILYLDDAETMPIMPLLNMKVGNQSVTQRDHTAYIACVGIEQQRTYVPKRGTSSKKSRQYVCINSKEAKDDKEKESVKRAAGKKRKRDDDTFSGESPVVLLVPKNKWPIASRSKSNNSKFFTTIPAVESLVKTESLKEPVNS